MTTNTKLEERFDAEFSFFKDMTITSRQAGDFERANLLQIYYRQIGEDIKAFIAAEIERAYQEGKEDSVREHDHSTFPVPCRDWEYSGVCKHTYSV